MPTSPGVHRNVGPRLPGSSSTPLGFRGPPARSRQRNEMIHVLLPLLLLANGMAAGGLMIALLGGAPLQFVLPVDSYVVVQQFLTTRFDPFMPICLVITILMDGTLAATTATSPFRWLAAIAGVLTASAISVSLTKNFPINKFVR